MLSWKEVRLNLVHPKGSVTPVFGGNFAGGVEESVGSISFISANTSVKRPKSVAPMIHRRGSTSKTG
jgi:hypothetical protein